MDDRVFEVNVLGTENGTVAEELEDTHAVFYYVREGTHLSLLFVCLFVYRV